MPGTNTFFSVRPVEKTPDDLETLARFCHELAVFDGHKAQLDAEKLGKNLFYPGTNVQAFFGCRKGEPVGFILAYESFTVYHGERGLYIPGAYIVEKYRHLGYGVRLFKALAQRALENDIAYVTCIVESQNLVARDLYLKFGAEISEGWSYVRLGRDALQKAVRAR